MTSNTYLVTHKERGKIVKEFVKADGFAIEGNLYVFYDMDGEITVTRPSWHSVTRIYNWFDYVRALLMVNAQWR